MTGDDFLREARFLHGRRVNPGRVASILSMLWAVNSPQSPPLPYRCRGDRIEVDLPPGDRLVWTGECWEIDVSRPAADTSGERGKAVSRFGKLP